MIALGVTPSCFVPPPCLPLRCGRFQLLCAPAAQAGTPRDRMRLHLACADHLLTLLPFAPALETGSDMALSWGIARSDGIEAALLRLAGARQLSLDLRAAPDRPGQAAAGGADWLKRRAAAMRQRTAALEALRRGVEDACAGIALRDRRAHPRQDGLRLHLLFDRAAVPAALEALRQGLRPLPGCTLTVTGPWPPYDFAGLGEIA